MSVAVTLLIGFAAGIVTGLIGASGVMVIVPGLTMLGHPAADAIGASLFADTLASLVVAWTYYRNGNLNLKQGWWIAVGSVLGAQLGSIVSPYIPDAGLGNSFGIFLILTAAIFWLRSRKKAVPADEERAAGEREEKDAEDLEEHIGEESAQKENVVLRILRKNVVISSLVLGMLVGVVSGLMGAGGGVAILLILVFVLKYKMHEGVGTSTLIMAFTAASGALGHAVTGNLPIMAALYSALGTVVGGRISARYANKVNEATLSRIVGAIFCILGIMMLAGIG